jgi:hypothetical protein
MHTTPPPADRTFLISTIIICVSLTLLGIGAALKTPTKASETTKPETSTTKTAQTDTSAKTVQSAVPVSKAQTSGSTTTKTQPKTTATVNTPAQAKATTGTTAPTPAGTPQGGVTVNLTLANVSLSRMSDGTCEYSFGTTATASGAAMTYFNLRLTAIDGVPSNLVNQTENILPNPDKYSFTAASSTTLTTDNYHLIPGGQYSAAFTYYTQYAMNKQISGPVGYFDVPSDCVDVD